jgi:hypothetical protein
MEVNWYSNTNKVINLQFYSKNGFAHKKTKWSEFLVFIFYLVFKTLNTKELIHQKYWIIVNSLAWFLNYCHVILIGIEVFPGPENELFIENKSNANRNEIRITIIKLLTIPS